MGKLLVGALVGYLISDYIDNVLPMAKQYKLIYPQPAAKPAMITVTPTQPSTSTSLSGRLLS